MTMLTTIPQNQCEHDVRC